VISRRRLRGDWERVTLVAAIGDTARSLVKLEPGNVGVIAGVCE
jgi:hypothetical protein